jgi:choline dehydrogenase-like flavoprotein
MTTLGTSQLPTTGTTTVLPAADVDSYDYLIVGGGTAGCVIASRLAEYLPHKKILLIEAGPSDFMDNRVLDLKQWLNMLGGELDYDYGTTEQPNGSDICPNATSSLLWLRTTDVPYQPRGDIVLYS